MPSLRGTEAQSVTERAQRVNGSNSLFHIERCGPCRDPCHCQFSPAGWPDPPPSSPAPCPPTTSTGKIHQGGGERVQADGGGDGDGGRGGAREGERVGVRAGGRERERGSGGGGGRGGGW